MKIHESAMNIVRMLQTSDQLDSFGYRLTELLLAEKTGEESEPVRITPSRAKALMRSSDLIDAATMSDFFGLVQRDLYKRVALYDLLADSGLADKSEVRNLTQTVIGETKQEIDWLTLSICSYATKASYPVRQLDPSLPPEPFSPAGLVLRNSATFVRKQVQRSASERELLAKRLAKPLSPTRTLDQLEPSGDQIPPLPPHYRPPIPERYPEMSRETIEIDQEDISNIPRLITSDPLIITEEELGEQSNQSRQPVRMPSISISREQLTPPTVSPPSPLPETAVVLPSQSQVNQSRPSLALSIRQMFGQEDLKTTKLKIVVQNHPDGPGLYGLQVKVTCKGIKSYVAGTTNREGGFTCELPVRLNTGLTYDVDVTWPRAEGGSIERKSITLNSDRTQFTLPFYRTLEASDSE